MNKVIKPFPSAEKGKGCYPILTLLSCVYVLWVPKSSLFFEMIEPYKNAITLFLGCRALQFVKHVFIHFLFKSSQQSCKDYFYTNFLYEKEMDFQRNEVSFSRLHRTEIQTISSNANSHVLSLACIT